MVGLKGLEVGAARTFLFVPGDRPERFAKATDSGADVVVLDLEDAVAPDRKQVALGHVSTWLAEGNTVLVRVNGVGTDWHSDEVAALSGVPGAGVMLPKAESVEAVSEAIREFGELPVILLIETALGIECAYDLCCVPGVTRVAFGSIDLAAQTGVDPADSEAMAWPRARLVNACAAAGLPGPIDAVTTAVADDEALATDLLVARRLGFTGKLCIHPRQVPPANEALQPTPDEVARAVRIVEAAGQGSVTVVDGQMIDAPVVARARRILERHA